MTTGVVDLGFILIVGLLAGVVSGVIGTGSSIMLVPVLVHTYGPKSAIPVMAVAAVMSNLSRVLAWWREVDWRAFAAYALPGAPAAWLGARTMLGLPSFAINVAIGMLLIVMVPGRRWLESHLKRLRLPHLAWAGAGIGFLSGVAVSTGPISVPVFLGYGLAKGAFISTEAASSLAIQITKAGSFRLADALPAVEVVRGLVVGAALMAGAFLSKPLLLRLAPEAFRRAMDGVMLIAGLSMLWNAAHPVHAA